MSGTVRFDDDNVIKFVIDEENNVLYLTGMYKGVPVNETVDLQGLS